MSDYIIHSSGEWKNHKWIRREGSPGNYKYYYKTTSAGNSSPSPRHSTNSHGSGVADTEHDKAFDVSRANAYPINGAGKYYEAKKFDKDRKKKVNAETKRRAMGEAYRNEMVNRMIDSMSGKTVTSVINAPARKKTNLRTNQYKPPVAEGMYKDNVYEKSHQNPTRVGVKGSRSHYLKTQETPKKRQRTADEYFSVLRAQVREKKATERANRRNKK